MLGIVRLARLAPWYTGTMTETDMASHGSPQPDNGEHRHTMTVEDVEAALVTAGVPRSHRQIVRYCQNQMLDAVSIPGPHGKQWYISPASIPKVIGDLKQWEGQRDGQRPTPLDMTNHVQVQIPHSINADMASRGEPLPAMSNEKFSQKNTETQPATASRGSPDLDIYEHPYVKRLEDRVEKLEAKYEAQVRRTEEIQLKSQAQLVELQRMTAVGQSQTLADFMLKAKDWLLGQGSDAEKAEAGNAAPS